MAVRNARIKSASISIERNMLTSFLILDYGSGQQGFGGYRLWSPKTNKDIGGKYIYKILTTLEVDSWDKLKGEVVRVRTHEGKAIAIGHFLKDRWFSLEEL